MRFARRRVILGLLLRPYRNRVFPWIMLAFQCAVIASLHAGIQVRIAPQTLRVEGGALAPEVATALRDAGFAVDETGSVAKPDLTLRLSGGGEGKPVGIALSGASPAISPYASGRIEAALGSASDARRRHLASERGLPTGVVEGARATGLPLAVPEPGVDPGARVDAGPPAPVFLLFVIQIALAGLSDLYVRGRAQGRLECFVSYAVTPQEIVGNVLLALAFVGTLGAVAWIGILASLSGTVPFGPWQALAVAVMMPLASVYLGAGMLLAVQDAASREGSMLRMALAALGCALPLYLPTLIWHFSGQGTPSAWWSWLPFQAGLSAMSGGPLAIAPAVASTVLAASLAAGSVALLLRRAASTHWLRHEES